MYRAKHAGRNHYQLYRPDMQIDTRSAFHLEVAMRQALESQAFKVHFQPIVDAHTRCMVGMEALGVTVSGNDFGTGYSSLAHLKRFSLDIMKIDRTLVEAIIGPARKLELKIIAEGVENDAQATFLEQCGAGVLQGFLFSHAYPADKQEQRLAQFCNIRSVT
jgi:EAL domain-containing protein (putative c-di-GMP-specific phosphodiesterase class I)